MKKNVMLLALIIGMFLFSLNSIFAFEFDNVKSYNPVTREVTIKNSFGLGADIGKARLNTPLNYKVAPGYQKVAEFDLWAYQDYNDILKSIDFYDKNKVDWEKNKLLRTYDIKFKTYENILIDDFKTECFINEKDINKTQICKKVKIGSHYEIREIWKKINSANLKKNEVVTLGIFTEVKFGDYVEWIPQIYGVRIDEWATWESDLKTNLLLYYKMDETSGTTMIDSHSTNNGTYSGATINQSGLIGRAVYFDGVNDYANSISGFSTSQVKSISLWFKTSYDFSGVGNPHILGIRYTTGGDSDRGLNIGNGFVEYSRYDGGSGSSTGAYYTNFSDNQWHHIVITEGSGGAKMYYDGVNVQNDSVAMNFTNLGTRMLPFGARTNNGAYERWFNGTLDEIGIWSRELTQEEITFLYNDGEGLTYEDDGSSDNSPNIILNSPSSTNYTTRPQNIQINFSVWDDINLSDVKLYVNGILNQTNASGLNNSIYLFNLTLGDGDYSIYGKATDNASQERDSSTILIKIDSTAPTINITSPVNSYDYLYDNRSIDLNYSINDTNLDSCWYNYNGTNNTLNCSANTTFNYISDVNNLTVYANDTLGNYQSNFISWAYKVLEVNQTFNAETTEGSLETFLANIKLGSGISIEDAVLFNYNGTETIGQAFTSGDYGVLRKTNMLVPSVSTDTNFTFYWDLTLSDSTELNLSSQNQTVYNLAVDNCSSYTNELLNFTVVDEEEQTLLPNTTIETAFNFYDSTRNEAVFNYSMQFEGVNPLRICLNRNLTGDSTYSMDVIVRYEGPEHANEYYNIVNSTINNESTTQRITLYDLNLSDSTDFQLTFTGSDFLPIENALIYVDRQYISENTFKTVELPKTDYNGQTILHLVRNDIIYNIRVVKDGEVLGNFENIIAFCEDFSIGNCNIELNAFDSVTAVFNYDDELGIIYTGPSYNETSNKITFDFVTEDGEARTVKLEVSRNDIFGNRSVCNSTLTSSGGTLTCNIDPNLDESTLKTEVYVDNVLAVSGSVKLDSSNYGTAGYLIMFVMVIAFALMFSGSKTGVLLSMGLTLIAAVSLGLVTGDIIGIGASGLWLLVIIIIGIIKLNNERVQ